ncbi:sulfotransferase family protein [Mastigocoleus testarum]|uniref:Sulfotransferase n=1 Tax=Mastigocoleus testarum BC008 TaxID=371196 RepID=A0A0V7ZG66_9CYAN|nr:sulfotransferase [Mastigocoleus testarum]KST63324.1 hypothetical protein BC008_39260 [Mastigocoleus testarum BC008]
MVINKLLKPSLRAVKYNWLWWSALSQANANSKIKHTNYKPISFIIGCGRSGTTILGDIFSNHPQVSYLFEPYHLWAAIDRKCDVLNLFQQIDGTLLMDASHYSEQSHFRFNHLIRCFNSGSQAKILIEKTPLNALRIGYIQSIAPNSKFIHIVRDGVDVCRSIQRLASTNSYKIAGKPALNQWWGVDYAKWKALVRDGTAAGYYSDEVYSLENHLSKGAYEWLVTLHEIDSWKQNLGEQLQEITYDTLIAQPESTLKNLCVFLNIDSPQSWLDDAAGAITSRPHNRGTNLNLPPKMLTSFNQYQERYGFVNRAIDSN